jgi:ABC-type spermidine/putrescine transport system permease subunit II
MLFSNNAPSALRITFCFIFLAFLTCPLFYTTKLAFCELDNSDMVEFGQYWYKEVPIPQLLVSKNYSTPLIIHSTHMAVVSISSYLISMVLAKKTLAELKEKASQLSFQTKFLQHQLARYFPYLYLLINGTF